MIKAVIARHTAVFGAPKNWDHGKDGPIMGLPVRVEEYSGSAVKGFCSAWAPTPDELAILNAGGFVILSVLGGQPPVMLTVEPRVEDAPT